MNESDLSRVLARATESVESPDLGPSVLAAIRTRRHRRRAMLAGAATAMITLAVVVAGQVLGGQATDAPPARSPATSSSAADSVDSAAPPIPDEVVQPPWDPTDTGDLPLRNSELPEVIEQPTSAVPLAGNATYGYRLALWGEGDVMYLLGADGGWRSTPAPTDRPETAQLSGDGTALAMAGSDAIWWVDLRVGDWKRVDYPAGFVQGSDDRVALRWVDSTNVVATTYERSWLMDLSGQERDELPYPRQSTGFDVGAGVTAVESALDGASGRRVVRDWQGQVAVRTRYADELDVLQRLVLGDGQFVATREVSAHHEPRTTTEHDGLIVVNQDDLATRAYLPVDDEGGEYSLGAGYCQGQRPHGPRLAGPGHRAGLRHPGALRQRRLVPRGLGR